MPTWTGRTTVTTVTRHEWTIPAPDHTGAHLGDIKSALDYAAARYREVHGLTNLVSLPDDALRFHVTDDAIVISFTTEQPAA